MTPLTAQRMIAVPFVVLGAWCLFFPQTVERLGFRPEYYHGTATTALMMGCFGAQAMLAGLFAWFSRFTRTTFLAYGIALLPFFWFNYWFVFVVPMFSQWMAFDFIANAAMLALCVTGYRASNSPAEQPSEVSRLSRRRRLPMLSHQFQNTWAFLAGRHRFGRSTPLIGAEQQKATRDPPLL